MIIGGLIAIGLVALVVVSLAGMYMLQRMDFQSRQQAANAPVAVPQSQAEREPERVEMQTQLDSSALRKAASSEAAPRPTASGDAMTLADLIEVVEPSVVRIDVKSGEGQSIGSGVFVKEEGVIVTNFHVVQGAYEVKITSNNGMTTKANGFYHADPLKDLAVIKVDSDSIPVAPIGLSDSLPRKGEEVAAFGSPLGFSFSATEGVVSSVRNGAETREALNAMVGIDIYSLLGYSTKTNWIQMTAAISGGNSGGPLVNMQGELIGINTWTHPAGQNLNFASTIDEVRSMLEVAGDAKLKNFSQLPRKRINIQFESAPGRGSDNVASNPGRAGSSRGNSGSGRNNGTIRIMTPEEGAEAEARERGSESILMVDLANHFNQTVRQMLIWRLTHKQGQSLTSRNLTMRNISQSPARMALYLSSAD